MENVFYLMKKIFPVPPSPKTSLFRLKTKHPYGIIKIN
jgi:hypothetical protein